MISAARAVVLWERVWPALWPGTAFLGLYAVLALTGALEALPSAARIVLLIATVSAVFVSMWRTFSPIAVPGWGDGARRLERDSDLEHRPLTEGKDALAAGHDDPITLGLWRTHVVRLLASARRLHLRLPSPGLQRRDRYGVRFVLLAGVILAFVFAGPNAGERLYSALVPPLADPEDEVLFNAWVSPPPYTAQPPRTLAQGSTPSSGNITTPQGSVLVLRLLDANVRPQLTVAPSAKPLRFTKSDSGYEAKLTLNRNTHVSVRIGAHGLGDWYFAITPDQRPTIAFNGAPKPDQHQAVQFSYKAADDYGVVNAVAKIVPVSNAGKPAADVAPLVVPLSPPSNAKQLTQSVTRDLTSNPYAGTKVSITLVATDAAGQTGESAPLTIVLPERLFTHPMARAIIEQRKGVAVEGEKGRARAETAMDALTIGPDRFFKGDLKNYLAMRTLKYRLGNAKTAESKTDAMSLMWDTAVALEEGELADAAEALRNAQQQLMDALRRGASDQEIQQLMQRLRQAMQRYLQQLARNARPGQMAQIPPGARMMGQNDLEALLKAIEDLARTGARDQAAQLLAGLMQLLQNMQVAQGMGQGQGQGQPGQPGQQGQQGNNPSQNAIQGLGDLMGQQRQLMDRTFRAQRGQGQGQGQQGQQGQGQQGQQGQGRGQGQFGQSPFGQFGQGQGQGQPGQGQPGQGQPGGSGGPFDQYGQLGPGALSQDQQNLRDRLQQIIQGLNGNGVPTPDTLNGAGQSMGQAQNNLAGNQFGNAAQNQQNALDQLRQGAQQLAKNLPGNNQNDQQNANNLDPLGRPVGANGSLLGGQLKVPDESDLQRAREILDELRKRAAELGRPQEELDYIDRLLKLF